MKVFIYDKLLNSCNRNELKLPLQFVSFARIEGKMYTHYHYDNVFAIKNINKNYGNKYIYGAIFELSESDFYIRTLDAYYTCSLSALRYNHNLDLHHRTMEDCIPIQFKNMFDFIHLKHKELEKEKVWVYLGNTKHKKISTRLNKTHSYRISDGVLINDFNFLYLEEKVNE